MMSSAPSLPSFAQAFSSSSLSDILPPIQSRKRSRPPPDPSVRIKEEDRDEPPQSPRPDEPTRESPATSKKRRVTLSGPPADQPTPVPVPIPISPAVSAFPPADDPPRPKQQPGQRRGSVSTRSPPGDQLPPAKLPRIPTVSRCAGNAVASGSQATPSAPRPLTPPATIMQQPAAPTQAAELPPSKPPPPPPPAAAHSLPPPPISFARRRAAQSGGRKKKPADILISPRGAGPSDPLAPVIQSAPPVADPGRFPMAIPRLPLALGNPPATTRRVAGNVPPTPTRFSLQGTAAPSTSISSTARSMVSPPNPPVPIANALVPPTPHALHHPGYTGDKTAFLAPFEVFYDALNDSKQLKTWLSDQLQKSNALMLSLKQQQEKMDAMVEDLVEKRTRVMREEMSMLRQRMESLEEALLAVRADASGREEDAGGYGYPAKFHQNGAPEPSSSYRFPKSPERPSASPPVEVGRRLSVSATSTRAESFSLGGHNRVASGSKGTPPTRPLAIPERPSNTRPTDSRGPARYYSGTYGNGSEGQTT